MHRKLRGGFAAGFVLLMATGVLADPARAQEIVVSEMRLPTHSSGKKGLEAVMVRPADSKPHPLALITHGTPREPSERDDMTPLRWIPQAREFAKRGWTAVIVMRRGYGDSGGGYEEDGHVCGRNPDFVGPTKEAVKDLREAAGYLATRQEVDPARMIGIGVSTGGMSMVGLSADPPPGLMAAISFAGGRGSRAADEVCNPGALVSAFGEFGRRSKVPMLWIYAENDHFFGPPVAKALYQAFTQNGGKAKFILAPPFGEDGHSLFSLRGIQIWAPMVDDFLRSQNLVLRDTPLEVHAPAVEPPEYLSSEGRDDFRRYLLSAPHKAFVASAGGAVGMFVGQRTTQSAEKHALENCKKAASKNETCAIVMRDDEKVAN